MNSTPISGQSIRLSGIKKSSKSINLQSLINKTKNLSNDNKIELVNLKCYLNVALRSRYSGLENDPNIRYFKYKDLKSGNFKITQEGVKKVLESIFDNVLNEDVSKIISMCTHRHTTFDPVNSFTKTAQQFFKDVNLNCNVKTLKDIKKSLDSNLKIKLENKLLNILIKCANNNLSFMNLEGADLEGADLNKTCLNMANLKMANLEGANLEEASLTNANLEGASLTHANLSRATLITINLSRANLTNANLEGATLIDVVNLNFANLSRANLEGASITHADLRNANLRGANLKRANLERANLTNANLEGANLEEANLTAVIGLPITAIFEEIQQKYQIKFNYLPNEIKIENKSCNISLVDLEDDTDVIVLVNKSSRQGENVYKVYEADSLIEWLKKNYIDPITKNTVVFYMPNKQV
ncbi:MAG TPA: pentapeptide repeat-containing protein [Burkholderiales bacterium]|nr:pentapeptide repeat-containing protein [Burkholderiales bacterium]